MSDIAMAEIKSERGFQRAGMQRERERETGDPSILSTDLHSISHQRKYKTNFKCLC